MANKTAIPGGRNAARKRLYISSLIYISESTIKFHIKNILKKTGCTNGTEVIKLIHDQ